MRVYKKRVSTIYRWRRDVFKNPLPFKENLLTFSKFIQLVFDKITLELELKYRKFRKKEILTPIPISPWRGIRLGLNMLLKNTKTRIDKKKRIRKNKFLYNVLDELWDTQNNISLTCKQVVEFTTHVLENSENYRSTKLFPVRQSKRIVVPKILKKNSLLIKNKNKKKNISKKRTKTFLRNKKAISLKKKIRELKKNQIYINFLGKYFLIEKKQFFLFKKITDKFPTINYKKFRHESFKRKGRKFFTKFEKFNQKRNITNISMNLSKYKPLRILTIKQMINIRLRHKKFILNLKNLKKKNKFILKNKFSFFLKKKKKNYFKK